MCGALASATDPRAYTSDFTLCHEDPTGQIHPLFAYRAWLTKSSHRATARGSRDCPLASPRALGYKYRSLYAPVYHRSCTESISPTSGRHGERVRTMPSARSLPCGRSVPPPPLGCPGRPPSPVVLVVEATYFGALGALRNCSPVMFPCRIPPCVVPYFTCATVDGKNTPN
jgi:hypothetical protein